DRRKAVAMDGPLRARDDGALLERVEEDRIHQTRGCLHLHQHGGMPQQGHPHRTHSRLALRGCRTGCAYSLGGSGRRATTDDGAHDGGWVVEVVEGVSDGDDGVGGRNGVVGERQQADLLGVRCVLASQLEHGRRGVGGDHAVTGVDEVLGQEPAAATQLDDHSTSIADGLESGQDAGRAGGGVEAEPDVMDQRQVAPVVGIAIPVGHGDPGSPVSSSRSKASSSMTGTPSSSAFDSFAEPGSSPTTTYDVFFDTLPGDAPPRALMASTAASRECRSSVPVTTTDFPASVWGRSGAEGPARLTPAVRSLSTTTRLRSRAKNSWTLRAITGPTPS